MPPLEEMDRNETAVMWKYKDKDQFANIIVYQPVAIQVRWEQTQQGGFDPQARPVDYDVTVEIDDNTIPENSLFWLGELADWPGTGLSNQDEQVFYLQRIEFEKDLKGRITNYLGRLKKFMGSIGAVE